jgi:hypothetical protein
MAKKELEMLQRLYDVDGAGPRIAINDVRKTM